MILDLIKRFHQNTLEQYGKEHDAPWKQKVMRIHKESEFLFYVEEVTDWQEKTNMITVAGEVAFGDAKPDTEIWLYDGQGRLLGTGSVKSSPTETEEHRSGLHAKRRNCWEIQHKSLRRNRIADLSLVSDRCFE